MNPTPRTHFTSSGRRFRWTLTGIAACSILVLVAFAADNVPTDIQIPGTQPTPVDNPPNFNSVGNCGCHSFNPPAGAVPESVPVFGWQGGMMANAGSDPLFWATVAVAEQDFLPSDGGVGDLCLHCHSVKGWVEGRSTPTDGSGLDPTTDGEGIMCEFCHLLTDPDMANSIPSPPEGSYVEEQNAPFEAFDPVTGDGYYGGAEYVLNSGGTRLGPYTDPSARHDVIPSAYQRDARLCGTCHDVSNPAVGDLAPNHGAITAFTGQFSGVVNGPVEDKAALNNPPESYGIVERTFSEWVSSEIDTLRVNDFPTLPDPVLKTPGGALDRAYQAALWGTCSVSGDLCNFDANCPTGETCITITADYQQPMVTPAAAGDPRFYTCQTCHMAATGGDGANQGRGNKWDNSDPWDKDIRPDLPAHDMTGMSYWITQAVKWQDQRGTLLFGGPLSTSHIDALDAAKLRSEAHLRSAGHVAAAQNGNHLEVTVTNLTGHKLPSGYPEGRRMWINVKWYDALDGLIHEDGEYGELYDDGDLPVTVQDNDGAVWTVRTLLDPDSTKVYEAKPAMSQDWAAALISLGYPGDMVLEWDHETHLPEHTLQELADEPSGTLFHTFHFVLNNAVDSDNRIPPYRMNYDEAERRNALPIPRDQYGNPGGGGVYDHFDVVPFDIPPGAVRAEARLYYQATSWEYIQFLWKQPTSNPTPASTFLANEGQNMLDAWLNARWDDADPTSTMAPPFEVALATADVTVTVGTPGEASHQDRPTDQMTASLDGVSGAVDLIYTPACDATEHTIYYGDLSNVSSYIYADSACFVGTSGTASFDPGPGSWFFLVVANNGANEGSYGKGELSAERPEAVGVGVCDMPQAPGGVTCE